MCQHNCDLCTENAVYFHARRGGEVSVAPLSAAHARGLINVRRVIVVERIVARFVIVVDGDAFEAINRGHCNRTKKCVRNENGRTFYYRNSSGGLERRPYKCFPFCLLIGKVYD